MDINQRTPRVTLNWQSFNIGRGNSVNFRQPSAAAIALNRIHQANPSRIAGALNANGQVYLINQNGIVFADGAQVNTRGLVASSLDITRAAEREGITRAIAQDDPQPAFSAFVDSSGNSVSKDIHIKKGANLEGQQILIFAPNVANEGTIRTPDGQTVLAAGKKIYITTSTDPSREELPPIPSELRGLVVEVDAGGTVINGNTGNAVITDPAKLVGQMFADRGNVTLVGLAVNQQGRITARSSVRAAGTIRLLARDEVGQPTPSGTGGSIAVPTRGGRVLIGRNSVTEATPDLHDKDTGVDTSPQPLSEVQVSGRTIILEGNSRITARGGRVSIRAQANPSVLDLDEQRNDSRVLMESGAIIDVSGNDATLPAERNALTVRLQGFELKDSPLQRDGTLNGALVTVDLRRRGQFSNGDIWIGTRLADLREAAQSIPRGIAERTSRAGVVDIGSEGDVIIAGGARIDLSGGRVSYQDGVVNTTKLIRGRTLIDIGDADPGVIYDGVFDESVRDYEKWGTADVFRLQGGISPGYDEGKDAGTLNLNAFAEVLDGTLEGRVTVGRFQRDTPSTLEDDEERPFNEVPLGARLVLGDRNPLDDPTQTRFRTPDVEFRSGAVLPGLPDFDPRIDPLPEGVTDRVRLRPELLGAGGITRLEVYSDRAIRLPTGTALNLPGGSSMHWTGRAIDFRGSIIAPAGDIALRTFTRDPEGPGGPGGISLGAGSSIDVRGTWVNDNPLINPLAGIGALMIDGGVVTVEAGYGGLDLKSGSRIDASGGAQLLPDGDLRAGTGGEIRLAARPDFNNAAVPYSAAGELVAYGVEEGGVLGLETATICIAANDCGAEETGKLLLRPEFFRQGGFRRYELTSNVWGLTVKSGTVISPSAENFALRPAVGVQSSAQNLSEIADIARLPPHQRAPVSLGFRVNAVANPGSPDRTIDDDKLRAAGFLSMETGSSIQMEPEAQVQLHSNTRLFIDGRISAPSGEIALGLDSTFRSDSLNGFLASQTIWLGKHSVLSAPGAVRLIPNSLGFREGQVLAAGRIAIDADSGYLVSEAGSLMEADGVAATLDLPARDPGLPLGVAGRIATPVVGPGGRIELEAAEGMVLDGELHARAAPVPGSPSGVLSVTLDATKRNDNDARTASSLGLPVGSRTIVITDRDSPESIAGLSFDGPLPLETDGRAVVNLARLGEADFGDLNFKAVTLRRNDPSGGAVVASGKIGFEGPVDLLADRRIVLDAASMESDGAQARLRAPYIALGSSGTVNLDLPSLAPGQGSLRIDAELIDVLGLSRLNGFGSTTLSSRGDIRLRGITPRDERKIIGSLETLGDLQLIAEQVYPTTLTDFTLAVPDDANGRISIAARGTPGPVLSAGGALTVKAPHILQAGVLKAPIGRIILDASKELVLASGSLTSTSGGGLVIPFGRTENGSDWVYNFDNAATLGATLLFGAIAENVDALPQSRIRLEGPNVDLRPGATLDLRGGGDLLAYEFLPGLGGTRDVLDAAQSPDTYAILPLLDPSFAPFDPQDSRGFTPRVGDSVNLAGAPGLPAGTYALLPARYALLPGAWLVTAVDGYQDFNAGELIVRPDGSRVIAGRFAFSGGAFAESRSHGFVVRPGSEIRREATYTTALASTFFPEQARKRETVAPRTPADAGTLVLAAEKTLRLNGSMLAQAGLGGRGARVDVTGKRIALVSDPAATTVPERAIKIKADSLNRLGAESILVGGIRIDRADGTKVEVSAQELRVDEGARIEAPEVILAASDTVVIERGARVTGRGTLSGDTPPLLVKGDGALLRVSGGAQTRLVRTKTNDTSGVLDVQAGSLLAADGSMLLDATLDTRLAGDIRMSGGSLNLSASRMSLGETGGITAGLVLDNNALASFTVDELVLSSRGTLDFYGRLRAGFNRLVMEAAGIRGFRNAGKEASITAEEIRLANTARVKLPSGAPGGSGRLNLSASRIELGTGRFTIDGFADTVLTGGEAIVAAGANTGRGLGGREGRLSVSGDLALRAGRIIGNSGAEQSIEASGHVDIETVASETPLAPASAIGAQLTIAGASILHAGRIELPAGYLRLQARGTHPDDGITLAKRAIIDVSGRAEVYGDKYLYAPGGDIVLNAGHGELQVQTGALLNVSGAKLGGDAGRLRISTPEGRAVLQGTLLARSASGFDGGRFGLDTETAGDFSGLNRLLGQAGFNREQVWRVRTGSVQIGADETIKAHRYALTADGGAISLAGRIDASGEQGGEVTLNARDGITLAAGGGIDARASGAAERGGRVALRSSDAGVRLETGSRIDVSGGNDAAGGRVNIRLARTAALTIVDENPNNDLVAIDGNISGAVNTTLEAFEIYQDADGQIDADEITADAGNPRYADALAFITNHGQSLKQALGVRPGDPNFHLVPGLEIRSNGDLRLAAGWNLFDWRFGGEPGILTLRAAGNINIAHSLSDGFASLSDLDGSGPSQLATGGDSWSYRLVAGADLGSADPLGLRSLNSLANDSGNFLLALPEEASSALRTAIRTGTGDIDIAAARDVAIEAHRGAVIYTAGIGTRSEVKLPSDPAFPRLYPTQGGDISIFAQRDISTRIGLDATGRRLKKTQLITDWLFRTGSEPGQTQFGEPIASVATAWNIAFERFDQGVGALGGGDVSLKAGRDVSNMTVVLPTVGRPRPRPGRPLSSRLEDNSVEVLNRGDLQVEAAGDIASGIFYVGRGHGQIEAGGDIRAGRVDAISPTTGVPSAPIYTILALGDANIDVLARGGLALQTIVNPTVLARAQDAGATSSWYFFTYGPKSSVGLSALSGDVVLSNALDPLGNALEIPPSDVSFAPLPQPEAAYTVYPASLAARALAGDIRVDNPFVTFPAARGNLELLADGNIRLDDGSSDQFVISGFSQLIGLSDAGPSVIPTIERPGGLFDDAANALLAGGDARFADTPTHDERNQVTGLGPDEEPVRIIARRGDIRYTPPDKSSSALFLAKRALISAGRDIIDLSLLGQNLHATDLTTIRAGRDISFASPRGEDRAYLRFEPGELLPEIRVMGPGRLYVEVGRNLDLGTAGGITTLGNRLNPALADEGADVTILAGVNGQTPGYARFIERYFTLGAQYSEGLGDYMVGLTGKADLDASEAHALFGALSLEEQRPFVIEAFYNELRSSGRGAAAAGAGNGDFSRGFDAIATLFPGGGYRGEISLFFSRIYTLDGGDIDFLVPNGLINAGLATPPEAFGITKEASALGIVAQSTGSIRAFVGGDVLVNESRIFAADGGDILIWSSNGDIDAGRGAKTAISAPAPTTTIDAAGRVSTVFPPALTGSGIRALVTTAPAPGDVDLFAPWGIIDASEAGIASAGNLTLAALQVVGTQNIDVGGVSVGVPTVATTSIAASNVGASSTAASATQGAQSLAESLAQDDQVTNLAQSALSLLTVEVIGFGEERVSE